MNKSLRYSGAVVALGLCAAAHAQQVNRCTDAQGQTIYSDRRCEDVGGQPRMASLRRPPANTAAGESCPRRLSDLVAQIQRASDTGDVNHLSGIYWWSGVSRHGANRVIEQLEAIAQRPLVDIAPVFPATQAYAPAPAQPFTYADGTPLDADAYLPASETAQTRDHKPRPIGLRLEQTLANSATPARTVLHLRRQYNCFWISL